ncbi:hypothetical protein H6775_03555 [Candidatus Nomurabacteria bacterium]|nr:hypothetical protein [Candidatus Nomurabacteria bacterium]
MLVFFKKNKGLLISLTLITTPFVTNAATTDLFEYFNGLTNSIGFFIRFAMLWGLTFFIFGVFRYINAGESPEKRSSGAKVITHGLIALFLAVSVWAIVTLLVNTTIGKDGNVNQFAPKNITDL